MAEASPAEAHIVPPTGAKDLKLGAYDLLAPFHLANIDGDIGSLSPKASKQFWQDAEDGGADNSNDEGTGFA